MSIQHSLLHQKRVQDVGKPAVTKKESESERQDVREPAERERDRGKTCANQQSRTSGTVWIMIMKTMTRDVSGSAMRRMSPHAVPYLMIHLSSQPHISPFLTCTTL